MKLNQQQKADLVNYYLLGNSKKDCMKKFCCDLGVLNRELIRLNIPFRNWRRHHAINENYFTNIKTESQAYWLGFLVADGCVHGHKSLVLTLAARDTAHIYKFKRDINSGHNIKTYVQPPNKLIKKYRCASRIVIFSTKIVTDLKSLGLVNRKSLVLKPCDLQLDENLRRHYWRGVIDGDGCINRLAKEDYNKWRIGLCGTYEMCYGLKEFINQNNIITCTKIHKRGNIYQILFSGSQLSQKIINLLYKDATIFLDRKMSLAQQCMEFVPKSLRK